MEFKYCKLEILFGNENFGTTESVTESGRRTYWKL